MNEILQLTPPYPFIHKLQVPEISALFLVDRVLLKAGTQNFVSSYTFAVFPFSVKFLPLLYVANVIFDVKEVTRI
jgi:hypothetical protein